ncbi:MAG: hypothetical protein V4480_01880 [Patescibacteria group bacterium]
MNLDHSFSDPCRSVGGEIQLDDRAVVEEREVDFFTKRGLDILFLVPRLRLCLSKQLEKLLEGAAQQSVAKVIALYLGKHAGLPDWLKVLYF